MRFALAALTLAMTVSTTACNVVLYDPNQYPSASYSPCGYDPYYGYYCMSGDGSAELSKDLTTTIAQDEQARLEVAARHFAREFSLSADQGMKIARTVHDYGALRTRSGQDAADFARRLYGVEPSRIVEAASQAQLGNTALLDEVVSDAAKNFDTSSQNMRKIIRALHGKLIQEQGFNI